MMVKQLTVKDLIEILQKKPQELLVAYKIHSEQCLLEEDNIRIVECCVPREDGWVHHSRPDKVTQLYLMFPGN